MNEKTTLNPAQESAPATPVVLLVDDHPQNLELLEIYMEEVPEVRVVTARDGVEAMKMVAEHKPSVVLLDIMMPKMSGFEVCKQIKSNPQTRHTHVVMVTALSETGDIERATEAGTDDYITKPIDRKALVNLVKNLLQSRQR